MRRILQMVESYKNQLKVELSEAIQESQRFGRQCIYFGAEAPALSGRIATLQSVIASTERAFIISDHVIQVSCKPGEYGHLVLNLRRDIILHVTENATCFPTSKFTLPSPWATLEVEIVKLCEDDVIAITTDEYLELARNRANLTEEKARQALEYFHDTRIALHYDRPGLSDQVIVSPSTVICGFKNVFRHDLEDFLKHFPKRQLESSMVSAHTLKQDISLISRGVVSLSVCRILWARIGLQANVTRFMIFLLQQCNLAVCIQDGIPHASEPCQLLIPWLCSRPEPESIRQLLSQVQLPQHTMLRIVFPYFLPPSLFVLFVARCRSIVLNYQAYHWENGLFIHSVSSCLKVTSVVSPDGSPLIALEVWAVDLGRLWSTLLPGLLEMEVLLKQWSGLWVERWVVCPHCLNHGEPRELDDMHWFTGDWLNPELVLRQKYYPCSHSGGKQVADAGLMVPQIGKYGKLYNTAATVELASCSSISTSVAVSVYLK